jgi:hypothetical protein
MVVFDYSSSDEEFYMEEEEDIAMILFMHKNKRPKHGGSVFGREYIRRRRINADNKIMLNYFIDNPVYLEMFFRSRFPMSIDLFKHIAECVKLRDPFFE